MAIQVNIKWSVAITGHWDDVAPLFKNRELRDRYMKGIVFDDQKLNERELPVHNIFELTEVLIALDKGRREGKQISWEVWCAVGDLEDEVVGLFGLTEKGGWWDGLDALNKKFQDAIRKEIQRMRLFYAPDRFEEDEV